MKMMILIMLIISLLVACEPTFSSEVIKPEVSVPPSTVFSPTVASPVVETLAVNENPSAATPVPSAIVPTMAAPTKAAETIATPLPRVEALITRAKEMLAQIPDLNITADDVELVAVEAKQWRDSSLDCPRPGMMYNQVITQGYLVILGANSKKYEFHTNTRETVVLCLIDGQDALKVLQP